MSGEFKHLHEKLPKSEKILLDLLYDFDQLSYKYYDIPALCREILKLFYKGFEKYNYKPAITVYKPDVVRLKIDNEGKIVNANETDFQNSESIPITVFSEETFKDDEVGKITFPLGENLNQDDRDILYFVFSVLSQKASKLIESALKRVSIQHEKIEIQEKNQLLENIHMFMMQASEIVIGGGESSDISEAQAIEMQKNCLYQALKDALELNFWVEPVVIYSNQFEEKKEGYIFQNVFQLDETTFVKKELFNGNPIAELEEIDNFVGLNYTLVSYIDNLPTHIVGLGRCGLSESGKFTDVVLETVLLMLNIFALSYQTILKKEALFHQSVKDGLTKLFNRRYFDSALNMAVERCGRQIEPYFSLIMFDIDHFKKFNDTYGHQTGDDVLQEVANAVGKSIRKTDVFCRYGGEEFTIILPGTSAESGKVAAEKIRKVVEKLVIKTPIDETNVTISLGIAEYKLNQTPDEILKNADTALYQSKENGRNQSTIYKK